MLNLRPVRPVRSHEELFAERYEWLLGWAVQLSDGDRQQAEDLVHDAFVQFTLARPDLASIRDLDAYLYGTLRYLHLSRLRKAARARGRAISSAEFDSAEMGLRAVDPADRLHVRDELRRVCEYACARKETSKAGSVLILRFFHGYYPSEIAAVLGASRQAVEKRLRLARDEAKLYIEDPKRLGFVGEAPRQPDARAASSAHETDDDDLLRELRAAIFRSRAGECAPRERLAERYRAGDAEALDRAELAHVVSCRGCLDAVNELLGLPPLSERFPTDMLGPDSRDGGPGSGGAAGPDEPLRAGRRRARDVFEHRPLELRVAVNGFVQGSQRVGPGLSELDLNVNLAERIDFVEVFSEQEVRLLFLRVEAAPPDGAYRQSASVRLSDGRTLDAELRFADPWPTIRVTYDDAAAEAASPEPVGRASAAARAPAESLPAPAPTPTRRLPAILRLARAAVSPRFWLRPAPVAALLTALLVAALVLVPPAAPPASAAELLGRATAAEEAAESAPEAVLHRVLTAEETSPDGGRSLASRRVETWRRAAADARRVYDEGGALVAGEWRKPDGSRVVYRRGAKPADRRPAGAVAGLGVDDVSQFDLSARGFLDLVGSADRATVTERSDAYAVAWRGDATGALGVSEATIVLAKDDLRALEETVVVRGAGGLRTFRLAESRRETRPLASVAPDVFEPEPELLGATSTAPARPAAASVPDPRPAAAASAELEVRALYLLDRAGASLGDQVGVARAADGTLRVEGFVETDRRKQEILVALAPIADDPAVRIDVVTVAEASRRARAPSSSRVVTQEVEVAEARIPAYDDLSRYFSARDGGADARADEEIRAFSADAMRRSREALFHASALKRLVGRFSPDELRALEPAAREQWLAMVRQHARAFASGAAELRRRLAPVFGPQSASGGEDGGPVDADDLARAAARLFELGAACDAAVRSSFSISSGGGANAVAAEPFWRSLADAERLAAKIQSVT